MKWYHWAVIGLIVILAAGWIYSCSRAKSIEDEKNKRIAGLVDTIQSMQGYSEIDSNTLLKRGMALKEGEIEKFAAEVRGLESENEYLRAMNKKLSGVITVRTEFRIDTLRGAADTVYKVGGHDVGRKVFSNEWYNIGLTWSCLPYQVELYNLRVHDEISMLTYKNADGDDEGVMVSNKNPYVDVEPVTYVFEKLAQKDRFSAGIGLGTNNKFDLTVLGKVGYGRWGIWGTLNLNEPVKDRKVLPGDWRAGVVYEIGR